MKLSKKHPETGAVITREITIVTADPFADPVGWTNEQIAALDLDVLADSWGDEIRTALAAAGFEALSVIEIGHRAEAQVIPLDVR